MVIPTFISADELQDGGTVSLGEDEAHHMRVIRLEIGQPVRLLDGHGRRGTGTLIRLAKRNASVQLQTVTSVEPAPSVHLMLPVADKDRMLWLAEKATELAATSWRPVMFKRSKSVNPRGEGATFQQKVAARMSGALAQSRGAWLPVIYPEAPLDRAIAATPDGPRLVLDARGEPIGDLIAPAIATAKEHGAGRLKPITLVVGPEGGFEESELTQLTDAGFRTVRLVHTILRFETAALSALAVVRSALAALPGTIKGSKDEHPDE
jgi:16S rRNA (uracil1498-N3)-methyltransferase